MSSTVGRPEIGQWYERMDRGERFQVTGLDERDGTIEIQLLDGDVDELETEAWAGLSLERADSPEDLPDEAAAEDSFAPWHGAAAALGDPPWLERLA